MKTTPLNNRKLPVDSDLDQHIPPALQTLLKIEQMAQARFQRIIESVERGEKALDAVKRDRGLI